MASELDKIIKNSFKKIRIRKKKTLKSVHSKKMLRRNYLRYKVQMRKKMLLDTGDDEKDELIELEKDIADDIEKERIEMLRDKLKQFTDGNPDNMKISNMWKVFKNLGSNKIGKSYAKVNHDGKILTGKDEITEALRIEISERMRDRPIRDDLRDVDILENLLIDLKMEIAKGIESAPVSVGELEFVLNNLRLGKARDH